MLHALPDPEATFVSIYGASECAYWLDSSRVGARGRFSFMGDAEGPLAEVIRHDARCGEPLLDRLRRRLDALRPADVPGLPFEFDCGFVGYFGYEMKSEAGHAPGHPTDHPDAAFILSDRLIAFDHEEQQTYLLCLHEHAGEEAAEAWLDATESRLLDLAGRAP